MLLFFILSLFPNRSNNSLATYTYEGIAYRQSTDPNSPLLISFVASAEELLDWAGIPRRGKLEQGQIGFQRTEDESRVLKAKAFFQYSANQSPTAIVIGVHQMATGDEELTKLELFGEEENSIQKCRLTIQIPREVLHFDENETQTDLTHMVELVKSKIAYRVSQDERNPLEETFGESTEEVVFKKRH